jgi:hypothetical protein
MGVTTVQVQIMSVATRGWIIIALCSLLAGCGTDVKSLLEEEGRLSWESDDLIAAAEDLDRGLEEPVYDAEAAKHAACEEVIEGLKKRIYAPDISFGEQFVSDIVLLVVFIVPIGSVETCAGAQKRYKAELLALCQDLKQQGAYQTCPD